MFTRSPPARIRRLFFILQHVIDVLRTVKDADDLYSVFGSYIEDKIISETRNNPHAKISQKGVPDFAQCAYTWHPTDGIDSVHNSSTEAQRYFRCGILLKIVCVFFNICYRAGTDGNRSSREILVAHE